MHRRPLERPLRALASDLATGLPLAPQAVAARRSEAPDGSTAAASDPARRPPARVTPRGTGEPRQGDVQPMQDQGRPLGFRNGCDQTAAALTGGQRIA